MFLYYSAIRILFFSIHIIKNTEWKYTLFGLTFTALFFVDIPSIQTFTFKDNIVEGNAVSVTCFAITKTKPVTFEWLKNGVKINSHDENIRITSAEDLSVLVLDPVRLNDTANYTCIAKNIHGKDEYVATLTVKGIMRKFVWVTCLQVFSHLLISSTLLFTSH